MDSIIATIGIQMLVIAGDLAAFLMIWHYCRQEIKEYLNGKEKK